LGQIERTLSTRVGEHRNHIRRNSTQFSVITDHRLRSQHEFDWDNVRVLDQESNYNKRLISEMIHIKKQKQGLKAQTDTALLDPITMIYLQRLHDHSFLSINYLFIVCDN